LPDGFNALVQAVRLVSAKKDFDGAVILHGTDTLAYTASALSMLLSPTPFPVVITGAQRPLATLRNDARTNFISALEVAATAPKELKNRVLVVFHDEVFLGSRVRKKSALDFSAFESPRFPVLAKIGSSIHYQPIVYRLPPLKTKSEFKSLLPSLAQSDFPHVLSVELTPHFPALWFTENTLLELGAILLTLYTSGTAPTEDEKFIQFLKLAKKMSTPVFAITEREDAPAKLATYAAGKILEKEGVLWCSDLTPEAAYVKACFLRLLHRHEKKSEFYSYLVRNWNKPVSDECSA
jgi:L-asparaginase